MHWTQKGMLASATAAAVLSTGCMMIVATDTGPRRDEGRCSDCHDATLVLDKVAPGDSLQATGAHTQIENGAMFANSGSN